MRENILKYWKEKAIYEADCSNFRLQGLELNSIARAIVSLVLELNIQEKLNVEEKKAFEWALYRIQHRADLWGIREVYNIAFIG